MITSDLLESLMTFDKDSYYQEKFTDLNIGKEAIKEIEFEDCEFLNCSFLETEFNRCLFLDCKFENCNISTINLKNSNVTDITFSNCKAIGIDWSKAGKIQGLSFNDSQINYSNFSFQKLPRTCIKNCEAKELDFSEADLTESIFTGSDLEKTLFHKSNLSGCDFRQAKNYYINPQTNTLKKAKFSQPEVLSLLSGLNITIE